MTASLWTALIAAWIWYRPVASQARSHERLTLGDEVAIPQDSLLVSEQDHLARVVTARRTARFHEQHQRQQTHHFGLAGHQDVEQSPEAEGFSRQVLAHQRGPRARGVPLIEDEIHDGEHGPEPCGQLLLRWHAVGDAGVADLAFRTHQPLRHGRFRHEKRAGNLGGRQSTEQAQRERHLCLGGKRRVAAGEDESQAVVVDDGIVEASSRTWSSAACA